ncbi:hypothetical protein F2Q68_00011810 [Brassica cretica]|uniref:Uncharacterized protein n=1 Tax=Brassica cretica TaxID=69181 RepID=A0A8S9KQH2_BRACR|nr:hypothetical protein F2Q68_00011810 [Brassica cretica]
MLKRKRSQLCSAYLRESKYFLFVCLFADWGLVMIFQESKILKFLGLCGIHSHEPGSVVFLSAIEIRGGVSWSEEHLRRREP